MEKKIALIFFITLLILGCFFCLLGREKVQMFLIAYLEILNFSDRQARSDVAANKLAWQPDDAEQEPANRKEQHVSGDIASASNSQPASREYKKTTVLFVGDIMLDRGVEVWMKNKGSSYPFEKIKEFLKDFDIVFGNLEGPIVEKPVSFPASVLKFAFKKETGKELSLANFNLLSLANNHTLNMGAGGLVETKKYLQQAAVGFVGEPIGCGQESLFQKNGLVFLAFNKTFPFNCQDKEIAGVVEAVRASSSEAFLIVSMHWGEEYQLKNSSSQQTLARRLIDAGADLIIGHHPHVVQNIEIYKGKIIFYSLGNFIFDQYFSKETQQGLAVAVEVQPLPQRGLTAFMQAMRSSCSYCGSEGCGGTGNKRERAPQKVVYGLFPVQSTSSQPFLMEKKEVEEFLAELAQRSVPELVGEIKRGIIERDPARDSCFRSEPTIPSVIRKDEE